MSGPSVFVPVTAHVHVLIRARCAPRVRMCCMCACARACVRVCVRVSVSLCGTVIKYYKSTGGGCSGRVVPSMPCMYCAHVLFLICTTVPSGHSDMCVFGRVCQTRIPLHQKCQPSMDVFERHKAVQCVFLVRRADRTCVYTKNTNKSVFRYFVLVCFNCSMPKSVCFWRGASNTTIKHTSALKWPTNISLDTSLGVC